MSHVGLVVSYLELGQQDEALIHASEVFKIAPNYPFVNSAKRGLLYNDIEYLVRLLAPVTSQQVKALEKERFVYKGTPVFSFEYPKGSNDIPKTSPSHVLSMVSPGYVTFSAAVIVIPKDMSLSEYGPKRYALILNNFGSNVEVISNKEITLKDGTEAYRTEIKWLYRGGKVWVNTLLVSALKEGKNVMVAVHPTGDPEEVAWIVESLIFQ